MTTLETTVVQEKPYVNQLMKKLISNGCCLSLLRFFVAHPNSRFSKLALIHVIDEEGNRATVEKALAQLIDEGILKSNTENKMCFYHLTREEPIRRLVLEMGKTDWRRWQMVLEHP